MLTLMKYAETWPLFWMVLFLNIPTLILTTENIPTLRASREVRTPLEGEYIEGEAAPPSKRKTFNVFTDFTVFNVFYVFNV